MKRFLLLTSWATLAICLSTAAIAQQKQPTKPKEPKEKVKADKDDGDKLGEYDEIIIKKKGDKGGKVTVEIKGDDVIVNGKPLSDYDDDNKKHSIYIQWSAKIIANIYDDSENHLFKICEDIVAGLSPQLGNRSF